MSRDVRIALVDGDYDILQGRRAVIESVTGFNVVLEESNAIEALARIPNALLDVLVIDQRLKAKDGSWLIAQLNQLSLQNDEPRPQIILTAPYHDDALLISAIRAGADDLVTQDAGPEQLIESITSLVDKGRDFETEALLRRFSEIGIEYDAMSTFLIRLGDLEDREREVVRLLLHGTSEHGISRRIDAPKYRVKQILDDIQKRCQLVTRAQLLLALYESEGRLAL
jgi:DNA-binding NarL/FixJ family response regulator